MEQQDGLLAGQRPAGRAGRSLQGCGSLPAPFPTLPLCLGLSSPYFYPSARWLRL